MRGITWLIIIWTSFMAFVFVLFSCTAAYTGSVEDASPAIGFVFAVWFAIYVALSLVWIMTKMDEWMKQNKSQSTTDADSPEEPDPPSVTETSEWPRDKTPRFWHFH